MTFDLFRLIEIKVDGYAGYAYTYEDLERKYSSIMNEGELYLVYGIANNPRKSYEVIKENNKLYFKETSKKPSPKWIPLNFYVDHKIASSIIWSGKEMESNPTEFTTNNNMNLNSVKYFWTESGRFMKDIIMDDSDISCRGVPSDCDEKYRIILSDEDRTDADKFFDHKSYITYATLDELTTLLGKIEAEWKSEIIENLVKQKEDSINMKLDHILFILNRQNNIDMVKNPTNDEHIDNENDEDDSLYEDDEEDMIFNNKYFLIQDLYKEIEGISLLVNGATSHYTTNSSIRVCYWVE